MLKSLTTKLQATVPDAQIVGPMTDDQYVNMADGKVVLVKQISSPVRTALHTMRGLGVMDSVSYAVLAGNEDYGPVQIPNVVTVALISPPVPLGSKTSQEADGCSFSFRNGPRLP